MAQSKPKSIRPAVPETWDRETSLQEWFPDRTQRVAVVGLLAKSSKLSGEPLEEKLRSSFPPALAQALGDAQAQPSSFQNVPSPAVSDVAMQLIAFASETDSAEDIPNIEQELDRILPEVPRVSLPFTVGNDKYDALLAKIAERATTGRDQGLATELQKLHAYLSTSDSP